MAIGIPNINLDLSALSNIPNRGGFGKFLTGDLPGPVLGPDDFGSYTIPMSDPTYRSGFDYARSIAGGMPMSQVIAPGVSYSPEQPMGYTQEQLTTPVGTTPVEPPQKLPGPGEEGYGQGIGGVRIFDEIFDRKRRPPKDLPPGTRGMFGGDPRDLPIPLSPLSRFDQAEMAENIARTIRESGMDFTNLFGMPSVKPPSQDLDMPIRLRPPISGPTPDIRDLLPPKRIVDEIRIDDRPIIDERVGTGGEFIGGSITPPPVPPRGISGPTPDIRDLILPPITSIENIAQDPRLANIPTITPPITPPMDIMDIPPMDIMDIPPANFPPMVELPPIRGIGRPSQNRFSIQQLPRGLF
tara:strand:- start:481 stop:1542 length:1062 start_codon:yes stop_codon:yes gene_type:complete